jgi:uncharacterized surface protein with fasciclin (FAS1) repeats
LVSAFDEHSYDQKVIFPINLSIMNKKYLAMSFAFLVAAFSNCPSYSTEGALGTIGEGVGTVGRGVGKGVGTVGRGIGKGVKKLPGVSTIIGEDDGVIVGGAKMLPSRNIVENASQSKVHTNLVAAVKQAGLDQALSTANNGPYTVFAPTDEAFKKLPADQLQSLLKPENKTQLTNVLTYHVVPGVITSRYLRDGQTLTTLNGEKLNVTLKNGIYYVNGAKITTPNVVSSNGVTHVIDSVLLPTGASASSLNE